MALNGDEKNRNKRRNTQLMKQEKKIMNEFTRYFVDNHSTASKYEHSASGRFQKFYLISMKNQWKIQTISKLSCLFDCTYSSVKGKSPCNCFNQTDYAAQLNSKDDNRESSKSDDRIFQPLPIIPFVATMFLHTDFLHVRWAIFANLFIQIDSVYNLFKIKLVDSKTNYSVYFL